MKIEKPRLDFTLINDSQSINNNIINFRGLAYGIPFVIWTKKIAKRFQKGRSRGGERGQYRKNGNLSTHN